MNRYHCLSSAVFVVAVASLPASAQRMYPQPSQQDLPAVKAFLAKFDPAKHHFPAEVATSRGVQGVRQPSWERCARNPRIDAMAPFRRSPDLTQTERDIISMALETSMECSSPFGAASNPFGRVPQGVPLTSLRSVLGKGVRGVDYRLANEAERAACTKQVSRPLPRFEADWTFKNAYIETAYVAYDVGFGGRVVNVRELGPSKGYSRNINSFTVISAKQAAAASAFENPVLNGEQLYCINIGERISKIGDGNGGVTGNRAYTLVFEDPGF